MDGGVPVTTRALWLWDDTAAADDVAAFALAERVSDVFLSVPWSGPSQATRALCRTLRSHSIRVACPGGDPEWAERPQDARTWALRALEDGDFDSVHLDIEPWVAPGWPRDAERHLAGMALAVEAVRSKPRLPVDVDVPAGLVSSYPRAFGRIVTGASRMTIMAYNDRSESILELSQAARTIAASVGRAYRIGVNTRPSKVAQSTFADDGRAVLEREISLVADALKGDRWFAGMAVHDFTAWHQLRP